MRYKKGSVEEGLVIFTPLVFLFTLWKHQDQEHFQYLMKIATVQSRCLNLAFEYLIYLSNLLSFKNSTGIEAQDWIEEQGRVKHLHCVTSVQMRSFFWSVFSCIRTEDGDLLRIWTFHVVLQWKFQQFLKISSITDA